MKLTEALRLIESGDREGFRTLAEKISAEGTAEGERQALTRCAARNGQVGILRDLFERFHLYDTEKDDRGRTVLHDAAASGDPETIAFAMNVLGFDPLEGDAAGRTPLEEAGVAAQQDGYRWMTNQLGFTLEDCYRNPVIRGFHPDPSVVRVGEDYYLVNSSFVCFPGLPVFHSRDLVHWTLIGHAVETLEDSGLQGLPGGFGYWAPDISYFHGRFWVVATLRRDTPPFRLQMITSADKPEGPWAKPKFLPLDGIDPSLFAEGDRRWILLNPGAMMAEISGEGDLLSEPEMIFFGDARIKPEGPHLMKKDGWYYLLLAEGGTGDGHMETVMRSQHLKGPYEACPFNPVLGKKSENAWIQRSGHGKLVSTPDGRWYMVYLCGRKTEGKTILGRETALDPVEWTGDGWPMVNRLRGPSCLQRAPYSGRKERGDEKPDWIAPRADPATFAEFAENQIILKAGADPAGKEPCSLLLRRQEEAAFVQSVRVNAETCEDGALAGLAGYYDERSFFLFGLRTTGAEVWLETVEQIGEERRTQRLMPVKERSAELRIEGKGLERRLMIREEKDWREVAVLQTPYLSDEGLTGGKRFTGALLGMAAVGNGEAMFSSQGVRFARPDGFCGG